MSSPPRRLAHLVTVLASGLASLTGAAFAPGAQAESSLAAGAAEGAEAASGSPADALPRNFRIGGQALLYESFNEPTRPSRFNPDNQFAGIPERQTKADLRVDLAAQLGDCSATAKLRGLYNTYTLDAPGAEREEIGEVFLNTGGVRCRLGSRVTASVGREVLQWGSAFYLSPSNPFFLDTGKTDPIGELYGKDFWQLSGYANERLTLTLMRNFDAGKREPAALNFSPATALKLDWVGEAASAGAIVSRRDDGIRRLGLYGTYTYSGAVLVYADIGLGKGHPGWFASPGEGAAMGRLTQSKLASDTLFHTQLFGLGYTFESGWTATAEWLGGNEGYSRDERAALNATVADAAQRFSARSGDAAGAAALLGTALTPGVPYLGTNTLFLQLARNEWDDKADVALRWAKSFGAGAGSALSFSVSYYFTGNLQGFAVGVRNFGGERSDFGRLVRDSVSLGFRYYL